MNKSAALFTESMFKNKGKLFLGKKKITKTRYLTGMKNKPKYLHLQIKHSLGKEIYSFHLSNSIQQCHTVTFIKV